ncbi:copper chaperone PCu(A)C [Phenylobacterium hankyongense]|uniref:copper chaperone PCu(A)C n=1 Tax=Phenylobacterium hankyongense TaxID=1813876 RepID=UPI00140282F2|nr:copper chaperone PCu(A)C [Phenylobacterium hankyongense]
MKILFAAAAAAVIASSAQAASYRLGGLEVIQPWSRPAAAGTTGVGYMTLANRGRALDALVAVASPVARKVEMHSASMAGGIMRMDRQDRVAIPAGGQVAFAPGGYHLMLVGLAKPLKAGDSVPATLTFASGAKLKVDFAVGTGLGAPAMPPMAGMGGMDHMTH